MNCVLLCVVSGLSTHTHATAMATLGEEFYAVATSSKAKSDQANLDKLVMLCVHAMRKAANQAKTDVTVRWPEGFGETPPPGAVKAHLDVMLTGCDVRVSDDQRSIGIDFDQEKIRNRVSCTVRTDAEGRATHLEFRRGPPKPDAEAGAEAKPMNE